MIAQIQTTEDTNDCPVCSGEGLTECPRHIPANDGWCSTCDTLCDGGPAGRITCLCQD